MTHKRANGFYKHYNRDGLSCRIRITPNTDTLFNSDDIVISFKEKTMLTPNIIVKSGFKTDSEVIHYLLKNLENDNMIFDVSVKYRGV